MSVANDYQVKQTQIGRQVFLLVRHIDVCTADLEIQEQGNIYCPLLIVVAPHDIHRRDGGEGVQYPLIIDVAAVKDGIGGVPAPPGAGGRGYQR